MSARRAVMVSAAVATAGPWNPFLQGSRSVDGLPPPPGMVGSPPPGTRRVAAVRHCGGFPSSGNGRSPAPPAFLNKRR